MKKSILDYQLGKNRLAKNSTMDYIADIVKELETAKKTHSWAGYSIDLGLAKLTEEFLEVVRAINDTEPKNNIIHELNQTAAMCCRMIELLREENNGKKR